MTGVIAPSTACNLALSNNGSIDFGTISVILLDDAKPTKLAQTEVTSTIKCSTPTRVGITLTDNRPGSAAPILWSATNIKNDRGFGLGSFDGKSLGAYALYMANLNSVVDGSTKVGLSRSADNGSTWQFLGSGNYITHSQLYSWGTTPGSTPVPYGTIVQKYVVTAAINAKNNLPDLSS